MLDGFSQALELDLLWNFLVLNNSLSHVGSKVACIQFELEVVSSAIRDLNWCMIVQFRHTFDFPEHDMISILV
jgi:hypothetical protein